MAGEQEKQLDELLNQAGVSEEITRVIKQGGLISISLFARAVPTAESLEEYLLEIGEALGRTDNKLRRVEQAAVRIAYDAAWATMKWTASAKRKLPSQGRRHQKTNPSTCNAGTCSLMQWGIGRFCVKPQIDLRIV